MTTIATTDRSTTIDDSTNVRTVVTAAGIAGALASAASIVGWFALSNLSKAELAHAPVTIVESLIAGLAFVVLAVNLRGLAPAIRLPRWALSFAGVACAFIAISAWAFGSVVAYLADKVSAAQFDDLGKADFLLLLLNLPMALCSVLAFPTLAVIGWRRQAMPRGASVLLVIAGAASLIVDFPPAGLLAGIALAWTARSAKTVG
jgi:hypothetical protein